MTDGNDVCEVCEATPETNRKHMSGEDWPFTRIKRLVRRPHRPAEIVLCNLCDLDIVRSCQHVNREVERLHAVEKELLDLKDGLREALS